jgi:hypothetical protein
MKGFASIEANGHAGELGSTGIRLGDAKFQVRRTGQDNMATSSIIACKHEPKHARRCPPPSCVCAQRSRQRAFCRHV